MGMAGRNRVARTAGLCSVLLFAAGGAGVAAQATGTQGSSPATAAVPAAPTPAEAPPSAPAPSGRSAPFVHGVELGSGLSRYDSGLGNANGQTLRYRVSRLNDFSLALDAGRENRFGETSIGGGASFTKWLEGGSSVGVGWGTGSGQVLAPRYRFDVGATRPIRGVLTSVGYTRIQSKGENHSDGYGIGLTKWYSHWIVSGSSRLDVGSPGRTVSTSGALGATWYQWKKIYVGGGLNWGDVSYVLLLEGNRAEANYRSIGADASFSRWFNPESGVNVKFDYSRTSFYRSGGLRVSVFRDF
jgi:YaiO family outer membrane protein